MARAWRIRYAGAKYHVTVRGNGRREVFHNDDYYLRFMDQLGDALERDGVVLYAYVLMPNHYHLFVETPCGNIHRFMQRLNTAYSMYRRYKHGEPGHCFQGRYGAKLVDGDDYIIRLTRYIHLNPVKVAGYEKASPAKKRSYLKGYKWCSYRGYVEKYSAEEIVNYDWLKLMRRKTQRGNRTEYRRYIERCISKTDEEFKTALAMSRYAMGDAEFIEEIEADLREVREDKGVYGDIRWPEGKSLCPDEIATEVATDFRIDKDLLLTRCYAARTARKVALELSCRYSNQSQRRVGEYFGYKGNGSVLKQRQRLRELLDDDKLRKKMNRIEKRLAKS